MFLFIFISFQTTRKSRKKKKEFCRLGLHLLLLTTSCLLVIVHPNLKNLSLDTHLRTKVLYLLLIVFLDLPINLVSKLHHPILLVLRELSPEPLLAGRE